MCLIWGKPEIQTKCLLGNVKERADVNLVLDGRISKFILRATG